MDPRTLAKVDLHRHLEGTVRLQTIIDLYREVGDPLPATTPEALAPSAQVLHPMGSLAEVLAYFRVVQGAFRTYEGVERVAFEAVEDLASDNVRLAELRYSPDFLCRRHGLDWDAALEAIVAGIERARAEHDVAVGLIAIFSRSFGMASAERTVAFTLHHRDRFVGFDLADDEANHRPATYTDVVAPLREAGIPLTAHYGEAAGPEFPRDAVQLLGVRRLGHGVSVARDPTVTSLVIDRGVALEMCPTSNHRTNTVRSLEEHPALRLLHQGARVTLNTDDPGLFAIDLTHELQVATEVLGFGPDDLRRVTGIALEASFLDPRQKAEVRRRHFGWLDTV